MKTKQLFAIALTVAALATTACDKKKSDQIAQDLGVKAKTSKNVVALSEKDSWIGEPSADLVGKALTVLSLGKVDELQTSRVVYDFHADKTVDRITFFYSDAGATKPSFKLVENGSFDAGDQDITQGATLDITIKNVDVIPLTPEAQKLAHDSSYCGHTDWATNEKTSITTESTDKFCFAAKGKRSIYDMVQVNGNKLVLGKDGSETTPDSRPKDVSGGVTYTSGKI